MKIRILKLLAAVIFLVGISPLQGQNKVDVWLRDMIAVQQKNPQRLGQLPGRGLTLQDSESEAWVDIIVKSHVKDFSSVLKTGGVLRTVIGPYATAFVPLSQVTKLARDQQVDYVSPALKTQTLNDRATAITGADDAIAAGFTGDNVLFGVIDTGIDVTHPGFVDDNGSRVLYLWDQTQDGSGTASPVYDYGTEWTKEQIDRGECTSRDEDGHGTHVAGSIAQFIASGPDSAYDGGATEANLIIVKTDLLSTHVLDGINYVFERARQLGKPAVVNLSLGSQVGPHDGTDLIAAAVDHLAGPGRIVMQAAGNDGASRIHHQVLADADGEDMTFSTEQEADNLEFDLWHDGGSDITLELLSPSLAQPVVINPGEHVRIPSPDGEFTIDNASRGAESFNQDKRIAITLKNAHAGSWLFRLKSGIQTEVHAWMWNGDPEAGFAFDTSDNHYTLVNQACGRKVIAVGATASRTSFRVRCLDGVPDGTVLSTSEEREALASFTSGGPTRDGRQKPDVIAPGSMIVSALSEAIACDANGVARHGTPAARTAIDDYRSIGPRHIYAGPPDRPANELHLLGAFQGTSMSTPVTAGSISPLLEQDPNITPEALREYIKNSSGDIVISLTGASGNEKRNAAWHYRAGYGLFDIRPFLDQQVPVVSNQQIADDMLQITFSFLPTGADDPANYEITGASSVTVLSANVSGNVATLLLSGKLKEGFRDWVRIQGLQGIPEPIEMEIEKIGTIVELEAILTNETWRAENSPYYIHKELQIPSFAKLTLEPGTLLKFMPTDAEPQQLVVFGELQAQGTEQSPIVFTSLNESTHGEWGGLYFDDEIPATTLQHCEIRYAENGVVCFSSNLALENCTISNSFDTGFLAQDCSPRLSRTIISNSSGGDFDDGIQLINASSSTVIENVTIVDNDRVGIACFSSNPQIINSVIVDNSTGIHSDGPAPTVTYSDVWSNNFNYSGGASPGTGSISADPLFTAPDSGDFSLQRGSPCLDAGNPGTQFNDPDGTRNDMGAIARLAELLSFSSSEADGNVLLDWETVGTDKVLGVLILRSTDSPVTGEPRNGVMYEAGGQLGNATVIFSSDDGRQDGTTIDAAVTPNISYHYASWAKYDDNLYSAAALVDSAIIIETAVQDDIELPTTFALQQNYPNPFNPETQIEFQIPRPSHVRVTIYNGLGQKVKELADTDYEPGVHSLRWDGTDDLTQPVSTGIYLYQIRASDFSEVRKMILLK